MKNYEARPYQAECVEAIVKAEADGCTKGLVVMASGLGKTLTAVFYLHRVLQARPDARVLVLCHQEEILLQSKKKFRDFFGEEYSYGMFTGTHKTQRAVSFLFSTFQTMRDYRTQFAKDTFAYVIVDEAHHAPAKTYRPTVDYFTPRFLLGLTATKDRTDGQDLLDIYGQILYSMDIFDGWAENWLAPVDYRIMLDDLSKEEFEKYVGPQAGNEKVSMSQLNKTIFAPRRDEEIVASIREQTADMDNPSMFVFCASIEHAKAIAYQFGGEAAIVHSAQSPGTNNAALEAFRAGDIRIIISVNMLNEGIDVPETNVVVFLRSTDSQTIFWQQLGRGLRISGEKRTVHVLDYVANIERISAVLEMETTVKKRIEASPHYTPSAKPDPIVVNIPATKFRIQRIDIERLLRRTEKWTRESVLKALRDFKKQNGRSPTKKDADTDILLPNSYIIIALFGTFNKGLMAANMSINEYNWTKEKIITALQRVARTNAQGQKLMPSREEIDANDELPSVKTIAGRFHGFRNAAKEADLIIEDKRKKPKYSSVEVISGIQRLNAEVVRITANAIETCSYLPSFTTCQRVLGVQSMKDIKELCDIE